MVTGNGTTGDGAGVLFANASAGTASYDNLVEGNYIAGNGLSGVTMHAHIVGPGQFEDLSGNVIVGNVIGKNNLARRPARRTARSIGHADDRGARVLRRHQGHRQDRPQLHIQQLDRHLAEQPGHGVRAEDEHVPQRDHPISGRTGTATVPHRLV